MWGGRTEEVAGSCYAQGLGEEEGARLVGGHGGGGVNMLVGLRLR